MKISNVNLVYFSAAYTTKSVIKSIAEVFENDGIEYDITQSVPERDIVMEMNDLLIVGVPVYAGRVPANALDGLGRFKGRETPAIIVCVYGNRDYDDALTELRDIVRDNGFKVISAGAFIARHSIFPEVGHGRPDGEDMLVIRDFSEKSRELLKQLTEVSSLPDVVIKGNMPYRVPGSIPLKPGGNKKCNKCGTCVKLCPAGAISADSPRKTDKNKCFSCGRCIVVCPQNARQFGGMLYRAANNRFIKAYSLRKEPEVVFCK